MIRLSSQSGWLGEMSGCMYSNNNNNDDDDDNRRRVGEEEENGALGC